MLNRFILHTRRPQLALFRRAVSTIDMSLGLNDEQKEFQQVALSFASTHMKPHAEHWDQNKVLNMFYCRGAIVLLHFFLFRLHNFLCSYFLCI